MNISQKISNKLVIVVTGSNRGLGLGIIKALSNLNEFKLILTSRQDESALKIYSELTENNTNLKDSLFHHQLDINSQESRDKFYKFIKEKFSKIDVLVNNSGVYLKGVFNTEAFDTTFNTNFYSTIDITEEILNNNLLNEGGKIVTISSSYGKFL